MSDDKSSESNFCGNCGSNIPKDDHFCTKCGLQSQHEYNRDTITDKKPRLSTKKKIGIGVGLFFGLLLILGSISNNSNSNSNEIDEQSITKTQLESLGEKHNPAKINDIVIAGNIAYKVTDATTTHYIGSGAFGDTADGIFIIVNMEMENKGTKSIQLLNNFKLIDSKGREFETDNGAWIYLENNVFLKQLQPSLPTNGQLVFDIPTTTESYLLEVDGNTFGDKKKYIDLGRYNEQ